MFKENNTDGQHHKQLIKIRQNSNAINLKIYCLKQTSNHDLTYDLLK